MKHLIRFLPALALALATSAGATPASIEDYVRRPVIGQAALSPEGTHLAIVTSTAIGRQQLAVVPLSPVGPPQVVAGFSDADVTLVRWVNSDRLLFYADNHEAAPDSERSWTVHAVNRDGTGLRELIAFQLAQDDSTAATRVTTRVLPWNWSFYDTLDDGSPDVLVRERLYDNATKQQQGANLWRLSTVTGERRRLGTGIPAGTHDWLVDGRGEPRMVVTTREGQEAVHLRGTEAGEWTEVARFPSYTGESIRPRFVDGDGQLYVLSNRGRDTQALFRFDARSRALEAEPLVSLKGFDFAPSMAVNTRSHALLGVHFTMEGEGSHWFDKDMRQLQAGIDAALPKDRTNRLHCGRCAAPRFVVVESSSDRQPGEYYLFDRQTLKLLLIGAERPWLKEEEQARRTYVRVPARDGLPLPVYMTRPAGVPPDRPLPAVVLVHDGPWTRGHTLRWSQDAQLLASRGYQVIEVDYRGSTGYGSRHFAAGLHQWGEAMQDDLADALAWAVKQGLADERRACIVGTGYGGYAALMGTIRHPQLYRCAAGMAAISDINLMYENTGLGLRNDWVGYGVPRLIGDRKEDAERLARNSPLQQVGRIRAPLLLAYGGRDRRVTFDHSRRFRAAAADAGVKLEWISYPDEFGWFHQQANEIDYWKRVEAFLARELALRPAP